MDTLKTVALIGTGILLVVVGCALIVDGFLEASGQPTISWYSHYSELLRQIIFVTWTILGLTWLGFGLHLGWEWK